MSSVVCPATYNIQSFLDDVDGLTFRDSFSSTSSEFHQAISNSLNENMHTNVGTLQTYPSRKDAVFECWQSSAQGSFYVPNTSAGFATLQGHSQSRLMSNPNMFSNPNFTKSAIANSNAWPMPSECGFGPPSEFDPSDTCVAANRGPCHEADQSSPWTSFHRSPHQTLSPSLQQNYPAAFSNGQSADPHQRYGDLNLLGAYRHMWPPSAAAFCAPSSALAPNVDSLCSPNAAAAAAAALAAANAAASAHALASAHARAQGFWGSTAHAQANAALDAAAGRGGGEELASRGKPHSPRSRNGGPASPGRRRPSSAALSAQAGGGADAGFLGGPNFDFVTLGGCCTGGGGGGGGGSSGCSSPGPRGVGRWGDGAGCGRSSSSSSSSGGGGGGSGSPSSDSSLSLSINVAASQLMHISRSDPAAPPSAEPAAPPSAPHSPGLRCASAAATGVPGRMSSPAGDEEGPNGSPKCRPVQCPHCLKTLSSAANLRQHIQIVHDRVRNHACMECHKMFSTKSNLKQHYNIVHTAERKYCCSTCGKGFSINRDLLKHMNRNKCEPADLLAGMDIAAHADPRPSSRPALHVFEGKADTAAMMPAAALYG